MLHQSQGDGFFYFAILDDLLNQAVVYNVVQSDIRQIFFNLAKFRHKIEIRYVINKLNYNRLKSFADFVYRNFPFTIHVTLMGLEVTGLAMDNFSKIWIDPVDTVKRFPNAVPFEISKFLKRQDFR